MPQLHVVRVFIGPGDTGGNLLGVFLDGGVIPSDRRLAVTAELGFAETVFVDDVASGRMAIFVPTSELPLPAIRRWEPHGCWRRPAAGRSASSARRPVTCPPGATVM